LAIVPEHAVGSELLWGDLEVKSGKTQGAQALDDAGFPLMGTSRFPGLGPPDFPG